VGPGLVAGFEPDGFFPGLDRYDMRLELDGDG